MAGKFEQCALPGCYEQIQQRTDGRPRKRYCCAAHRLAARQLRQGRTREAPSADNASDGDSCRQLRG